MDITTFLVAFDEFSDYSVAKIQYNLNRATNNIDSSVYGIYTEEAIGLQTAHYLALSPPKKTTTPQIEGLGFRPGDIKRVEIQDEILVEFNTVGSTLGNPTGSYSASGLNATSYSQQLEALKESLTIPFITC